MTKQKVIVRACGIALVSMGLLVACIPQNVNQETEVQNAGIDGIKVEEEDDGKRRLDEIYVISPESGENLPETLPAAQGKNAQKLDTDEAETSEIVIEE